MNYNIAAYLIYLILTVFIIVYVGKLFYKNGRIFILALFKGDASRTDIINNMLLIGYYLFNIGYGLMTLRHWDKIVSIESLIAAISVNMGVLIFILAWTHYVNMMLIYYLSRSKSLSITSKSFQS